MAQFKIYCSYYDIKYKILKLKILLLPPIQNWAIQFEFLYNSENMLNMLMFCIAKVPKPLSS